MSRSPSVDSRELATVHEAELLEIKDSIDAFYSEQWQVFLAEREFLVYEREVFLEHVRQLEASERDASAHHVPGNVWNLSREDCLPSSAAAMSADERASTAASLQIPADRVGCRSVLVVPDCEVV